MAGVLKQLEILAHYATDIFEGVMNEATMTNQHLVRVEQCIQQLAATFEVDNLDKVHHGDLHRTDSQLEHLHLHAIDIKDHTTEYCTERYISSFHCRPQRKHH